MHAFAVDLCAVGAFQVGQYDFVLVFLDFQMIAAHALVVQLDGIAFFPADGQRHRHVGELMSPIGPVDYAKCN